tara:strand:+ start:188 stop:979 length:792 start_codon:yes stop_codon:yes gene_type:complete
MIIENREKLLKEMVALAGFAGKEILNIRDNGLNIRQKIDKSPVTAADEAAEQLILAGLSALTPTIPIIAEEEASKGRVSDIGCKTFWLVDPLDGTKELINNRKEYTVNIGLIENSRPTMGVVMAPALRKCFSADVGGNATLKTDDTEPKKITVRRFSKNDRIITVSHSHGDQEKIKNLLKNISYSRVITAGSSLKFCLIANGEADIYPRYGPTREWDTAAGHAILAAAGGSVRTLDNKELTYGKNKFENPEFIAYGTKNKTID